MIKKRRPNFWILPILLLGLLPVVSCMKEDPSFYRRNLPGIWRSPEGLYYKFQTGSTAYVSGVGAAEDGGQTWLESRLTYQVNCCSLQLSGTWSAIEGYPQGSHLYREVEFEQMNDSSMVFRNRLFQLDGQPLSVEERETWQRVVTDVLKDSLVGIWQTVSLEGVPNDRYRFEFLSTSTNYYYYEHIATADTTGWILFENNAGTWRNYDRNLILTTFNNEAWGEAGLSSAFQVEVPVVSPKEGRMEWTTPSGKWLFKRVTEGE